MSSTRLAFACGLFAFGCGSSNSSPPIDAPASIDAAAPAAFKLEATDLVGGTFTAAQIFNGFDCTGQNASPAVKWSNPPAGTKSFVLTVFDRDAPTGSGFWHWTVFDIPAATTSLAANAAAPTGGSLPAGAIQGYTDFGRPGYGGPCPPVGDTPHRYVFKLSALNVDHLGLTSTAPGALVTFAALGETIGTATFTASFGRTPGAKTHPDTPVAAGFTLTSADVPAGGTFANEQILNSFGCTGGNMSPRLQWSNPPAGTQSYVLTVFDPDAPTGSGFWHWLAFDIPVGTLSLAKGAGSAGAALGGSGIQGYNDTGANAYAGPCPPAGDPPHYYIFTIYAIPMPSLATAGLSAAAPGGLIGFVTRSTAIAKATFTATYSR